MIFWNRNKIHGLEEADKEFILGHRLVLFKSKVGVNLVAHVVTYSMDRGSGPHALCELSGNWVPIKGREGRRSKEFSVCEPCKSKLETLTYQMEIMNERS